MPWPDKPVVWWWLGKFLAVLALLGQVMVGAAVPAWAMQAGDATPDGFPICHTAGPDDANTTMPGGHPVHSGDCVLCPVCHALGRVAAVPTPPAPLAPLDIRVSVRPAPLSPACAPPASPVLAAAYPTGPPRLA